MQNHEQTRDKDQPGNEFSAEGQTATENGAVRSDAELEKRLVDAESRAAEMQDGLLRAKAEVENMRRRSQEEIARAHKFAIEEFANALIPVKDSLEKALEIDTPSMESVKEGVDMTLRQLASAFEKNRLTEVNPAPGEKLDPTRHQAISMVPAEQEANTIVNVLQKGYMIADRLLRPALVTVSQNRAAVEGAAQEEPGQQGQQPVQGGRPAGSS